MTRSTRWQAQILFILLAVLVAVAVVTRADAAKPRVTTQIAEAQVALWKCQDQLGVERTRYSRSPWNLPRSAKYRAWVLNLWAVRWNDCLEDLQEVQRQWDWQSWLPEKWRRIGVCETRLNWRHSNSRFQGAFGFAIPSWDAFKLPGYPDEAWQATPWQQYQVALAIYHRYGFSGWGCRGA